MAGVYILETKGEFRPSYAESIDNIILLESDCNWLDNPKEIVNIFDKAPVFTEYEDALKEAQKMARKYTYLDDGIMVLDDWYLKTYEDIKAESHVTT